MQKASPMIFCPNMKCRAANPEDYSFCHTCQTRLPKRYLWVANFSEQEFPVGFVLAERFMFRGPNVVLDTQPGLLIKTEVDIPDLLLPYLRLFSYRVHYSQFYCLLWIGEEEQSPILLLENAPLCPTDFTQTLIADPQDQRLSAPVTPALPLQQAWSQAKPLRQLNWLWQISMLWDPCLAQGVAQSLLVPDLLRVEGRFVRLLELFNDSEESPPSLVELGHCWSQWKQATTGKNQIFFANLCQSLVEGSISTAHQLTQHLDQAIAELRPDQPFSISLATRTDVGVVRDHNEDQCFPPSGSLLEHSEGNLIIVCDGVGGHAGGEVASSTAIAALQEHLGKLDLASLSPDQIMAELVAASCHANDLISQRNDTENRLERQRMGTTLVMALAHDQQLFVAHIGDSRAYLITKLGCYQITVDDDIASREVRLGYLPYREALRQPTSGSLVQALGMASSKILHPTVQRFILDEDCLLLLCSDGLSDYDRVEERWQEELLPLLYRNYDLAAVTERLISLANQLNGHDNVTVALMHPGFNGSTLGPKTPMPATELPRPGSPLPETAPGPIDGEDVEEPEIDLPASAKITPTNPDAASSSPIESLSPEVQTQQIEAPPPSRKSTPSKSAPSKSGWPKILFIFSTLAVLIVAVVMAARTLFNNTSNTQKTPRLPEPTATNTNQTPLTNGETPLAAADELSIDDISIHKLLKIKANSSIEIYSGTDIEGVINIDEENSAILPTGTLILTLNERKQVPKNPESPILMKVKVCNDIAKGKTRANEGLSSSDTSSPETSSSETLSSETPSSDTSSPTPSSQPPSPEGKPFNPDKHEWVYKLTLPKRTVIQPIPSSQGNSSLIACPPVLEETAPPFTPSPEP